MTATSATANDTPVAAPNPAATGLLTIDLDAIITNWKTLESRGVPAECAAVVKADAYGCGLAPVTRALYVAGCKIFFVATLDEARLARKAAPSSTIFVLDGLFPLSGPQFAEITACPGIGDLTEMAEWDAFRSVSGWQGGMAIHIDTGMNRLGLNAAQALPLASRLNQSGHGIKLVMSHLACAEMPNHALNGKQINEFREIAHQFPGVTSSLANSSGVFLGQSAHFDLTRPGAALYGVNPTPEQPNPMKGVVTLQARIAQIRDIERGASVGYGATWTARKPTRLAIVAAGYADGYMRAASAADGLRGADVMVAGVKCPLAGRISMDLIAVDITDVPAGKIHRGDFVTLIGDGLGVDDLAHPFGTIGYEVLTALGARYSRAYRGGPDGAA